MSRSDRLSRPDSVRPKTIEAMKARHQTAMRFVERMEAKARAIGKSLTATFPRVPRDCQRSGCMGYHAEPGLKVTPEGQWYYVPSPYGFHSLVVPEPRPRPVSREEAVILAYELLAAARRYDPWAAYPDIVAVERDEDPDILSVDYEEDAYIEL